MANNITVGLTQGDFNGIGLEVLLKSLSDETVTELFTPVIFADWRLVEQARRTFITEQMHFQRVASADEAVPGHINVVDLRLDDVSLQPGKPTPSSGQGAVKSLETAVTALQNGDIDVLVTAPISKEAVQSDTFHFPGHTEYLNAKAGEDYKSQMILFDDHIRVALVTTHLPLSDIASAITKDKVVEAVKSFASTLRQDFGVVRPKVAVLSLNPHCGDGGLLGTEEKEVILPAIDECESAGILAFGPYASDGFFGSGAYRDFDGILAMYHDQGLAPFKALARENGVNFTAGLPFVRTSPDHGTAYDIAWKGEADPTSMREAIYKAVDIFRNRAIYLEASANPLRHQSTDRGQRQDKSVKAEKPEHNEKTEKAERNEKPERSEKPERKDKPESTDKPERKENPERPMKTDSAERPE